MSRFKKGDRVLVVSTPNSKYGIENSHQFYREYIGTIGTITNDYSNSGAYEYYDYEVILNDGGRLSYCDIQLVPVSDLSLALYI